MGMATKDLMFMAQIQRKFAPDTRKVFGKVEQAAQHPEIRHFVGSVESSST
jgi:hypothetical protein